MFPHFYSGEVPYFMKLHDFEIIAGYRLQLAGINLLNAANFFAKKLHESCFVYITVCIFMHSVHCSPWLRSPRLRSPRLRSGQAIIHYSLFIVHYSLFIVNGLMFWILLRHICLWHGQDMALPFE